MPSLFARNFISLPRVIGQKAFVFQSDRREIEFAGKMKCR
jgi:hypothetical protein